MEKRWEEVGVVMRTFSERSSVCALSCVAVDQEVGPEFALLLLFSSSLCCAKRAALK